MSEAVHDAIARKLPYRQTGVDDLESLVWVLHWFFHHFAPKEYNNGWKSVRYKGSSPNAPADSQPTTTRRSSPNAISIPKVEVSDMRSKSFTSPPSTQYVLGHSHPDDRSLHLEVNDPLAFWLTSHWNASQIKCGMKRSMKGQFHHWNSDHIQKFFTDIWKFPEWDILSGGDLEGFRAHAPPPSNGMSFSTLLEKLVLKLIEAADNARAFYKQ